MNRYKIGILAYGSLIYEPGSEIEPLIIKKIDCITPFKVEYARKSATRGDGPTLIPTEYIGKKVKAVILVLKNKTTIISAKSMLYRRETRNVGTEKTYKHSLNPTKNKVQIEVINDFENVENVIYTKLNSNIDGPLTADLLSDLAIASALTKAGDDLKDGVRYLLANKVNGIITELSDDYERLILKKTKSNSLEQVNIKLDSKRLK